MKSKKLVVTYVTLIIVLIISALLSLSVGAARLSVLQMVSGILEREGFGYESAIMLAVRLPRLIAALLAGVGLSLGGVILQSVMGNELASPNTVGVSSGAGLAAVICLSFFPSFSHLLPIGAFVGALVTSIFIMVLSRVIGGGRTTIILAGIALTSLFGAGISFFSILDTDVLASYSAFSVGGFSGVKMESLFLPAAFIFVCLFLALAFSGKISVLSLGDSIASGLGVSPIRMRAFSLVIASLSVASVISFSGLLGFVGLVVPHITRKLVGAELKKQLTAAPIVGATLVILSDLFGRIILAPSEISVGIIMAFIGAPFFFILLLRRRMM